MTRTDTRGSGHRPLWSLVLLGLAACGAKSDLTLERCGDAGVRSCISTCGEGTQRCLAGRWAECEVAPAERACESACGDGVQVCAEGVWGACDAPLPVRMGELSVRIRDFSRDHADFEGPGGDDRGLAADTLGPDDKPVYLGGEGTRTTNGGDLFDQWYRDVPGANVGFDVSLPFVPASGDALIHEDLAFFPIDGAGFGNEGFGNNFHFTLEASTTFLYEGGETLRFLGEDDLWIFVDRKLVIDLGGTHPQQEAMLELDSLGLTRGQRYSLHVFFAERHTDGSSFVLETDVMGPFRCE